MKSSAHWRRRRKKLGVRSTLGMNYNNNGLRKSTTCVEWLSYGPLAWTRLVCRWLAGNVKLELLLNLGSSSLERGNISEPATELNVNNFGTRLDRRLISHRRFDRLIGFGTQHKEKRGKDLVPHLKTGNTLPSLINAYLGTEGLLSWYISACDTVRLVEAVQYFRTFVGHCHWWLTSISRDP